VLNYTRQPRAPSKGKKVGRSRIFPSFFPLGDLVRVEQHGERKKQGLTEDPCLLHLPQHAAQVYPFSDA
jgi:hypothetical protein